MPKVIYYNTDDELDYEYSLLREWGIAGLELTEIRDKAGDKPFAEHVKDADSVVVGFQQIGAREFNRLPRLKIVALQSIGHDNVDDKAAAERGVCVTNVPGFCTEEVAVHSIFNYSLIAP